MLSYDELVESLESAWIAAGLHEHALNETFQPETLERSYRVELFPEHPEPLSEDNIPPWVEVSFSWSPANQLMAEGRTAAEEATDLTWNYMVFVRSTMRDYSDNDLVRLFQRAVHSVLRRFYPNDTNEMGSVAVEVRRIYQSDSQRTKLAYVQLASTNITDLSSQWKETDPMALRRLIRTEIQFASSVIQALENAFQSGGNGGYQSVDTA
jgi:hypothetical protein